MCAKIIGGLLQRNESSRWLDEFLRSYRILCDEIIVVDDASTDNSVEICKEFGCIVYENTSEQFSQNESVLRKQLWDACVHRCKHNDWIVILDADEIITPESMLKFRNFILNSEQIYAISLRLFDMWNEREFRSDNYWTAHFRYMTIAVKYDEKEEYSFHHAKLHGGRFPTQVYTLSNKTALKEFTIKHMGWSRPEDREKKYNNYLNWDPLGIYGVMEQYKSILDENPNLINFDDFIHQNP